MIFIRPLTLIICVGIIACSPSLKVNTVNQDFKSWNEEDGFLILDINDTLTANKHTKITSIKAGESGFTIRCDYFTMINLIKKEALSIGGNCIKITEHKTPDAWSTCHRITADVFRLNDLSKYEKEIYWNENRRLTYNDFKGSKENRPFIARTQSRIQYLYDRSPNKGYAMLKFNAIFSTEKSYMKEEHHDSITLKHEQNHFDLTEIYARILTKRLIDSHIESIYQIDERFTPLADQTFEELDLMNDKYDSEVYDNPALEVKWNEFILNELAKYDAYKEKIVEIPIRKQNHRANQATEK